MTQNLYRAATVCEVTGLKPVTLRQWHLRGLYTPEAEVMSEWVELAPAFTQRPVPPEVKRITDAQAQAKRQGWRVYTFGDLVRICVMRRLILLGITAERAALIVDGMYDPQPDYAEDQYLVWFGGDDADVALEDRYAIQKSLWNVDGERELARSFKARAAGEPDPLRGRRDMGVVVNISSIVRELKSKLSALGGGA